MRIARLFQFLLVAALALTVFMALNPAPPHLTIDRLGDKFAHMSAFAVLSVLARLSFVRVSNWRILERLSFFGALIEVFQAIPALHRTCDWTDWAADTASIAISLGLMYLAMQTWARRKNARSLAGSS